MFPTRRYPHILCLTANEKDFSLSLEMTIWGKRHSPPPSSGRRECPREPLPWEGAAERSEAGLASFLGGKAASSLPSPCGEGFISGIAVSPFRSPPIGIASPYA